MILKFAEDLEQILEKEKGEKENEEKEIAERKKEVGGQKKEVDQKKQTADSWSGPAQAVIPSF